MMDLSTVIAAATSAVATRESQRRQAELKRITEIQALDRIHRQQSTRGLRTDRKCLMNWKTTTQMNLMSKVKEPRDKKPVRPTK